MNVIELSETFPTELSCIEYLESLRWSGFAVCPYCNSENLTSRSLDYRRKCRDCKKSSSVTVNTYLHDTRLPLKKWIFAVSLITDAKKGLSALQLQRNLDVSYPTAFSMYHKIRSVMVCENKSIEPLEGIVEMDEKYVGGRPRNQSDYTIPYEKQLRLDSQIRRHNRAGYDFTPQGKNRSRIQTKPKRGRGTKKIPIVGIVERNGNVIAEVMNYTTYDNLKDMVQKHVDRKRSLLITDSYSGYANMRSIIRHIKIDHNKLYSYRGVNSNSIESFWAIIERGIVGQYHSVSPKNLPNYVAEFVYKYNNRKDTDHMFEELLRKMINPPDCENS